MKLSVIIPCLNAESTLAVQLEALASQQWDKPWEIIVADNGSTDASRAIVERFQKRVSNLRLADASARRGQPYALKVGVQASRGESLVFVDADDEVAPGWVAAIGNALAQYELVASRFDVEKLNEPWVQASRGRPQQTGLSEYSPRYLPFAGDCGLGMSRRVYDLVGDLDELLPYASDTDYCWRAQQKGISLHFIPEAVVHIRHRDSLKTIFVQSWRWADSNVLLRKKYQPLGLPSLPWLEHVRAWKRLFTLLPSCRSRVGRAQWLRQLGWRLGTLAANFKYRNFEFPVSGLALILWNLMHDAAVAPLFAVLSIETSYFF